MCTDSGHNILVVVVVVIAVVVVVVVIVVVIIVKVVVVVVVVVVIIVIVSKLWPADPTCHILPLSEICRGLCLAVFAGSGGNYLFHRIG